MVTTGNLRRENTQAYLIPLLAEAGFNVVAGQRHGRRASSSRRLPKLDYDLTMFINTVAAGPAVPDPALHL